jgi:hypothetical protein
VTDQTIASNSLYVLEYRCSTALRVLDAYGTILLSSLGCICDRMASKHEPKASQKISEGNFSLKCASVFCSTISSFSLAKRILAASFHSMNIKSVLIKSLKVFSYLAKLGTYFCSYPAKPKKLNISFLEVGSLYSLIAETSLLVAVSPLFSML